MKSAVIFSLALIAGTVQASPGAHGPNGEHLDTASATPSATGLGRLPDGSVNVPMLSQRRLAIRTQIALQSDANIAMELPAKVVADPNASGLVQAVMGGKVDAGRTGLPFAGKAVRKGDVLATVVFKADPLALASQRAQLAELQGARDIAQKRVDRLKGLEGSVPRKEIESAQSELASLTARERAIGGSLSSKESVVAPVSGVIARSNVVIGQVVETKDVLFEITDPAKVMVEATTADSTLAASISNASVKGSPDVRLELVGIGRSLREGVLPITFKASTSGSAKELPLAIGQPITVIANAKQSIKGYVLPAESITRNPANEPVVWIKSGAERYIPQPVQYQALDATRIVVTKGLGDENRVVTQGASLIAQIR
ncbi:efflux RND transporter periplasmic adaptor subunit [Giesbergeria anulus]|nr:HlyD family secretion protein [Giesbergeria anulus]